MKTAYSYKPKHFLQHKHIKEGVSKLYVQNGNISRGYVNKKLLFMDVDAERQF